MPRPYKRQRMTYATAVSNTDTEYDHEDTSADDLYSGHAYDDTAAENQERSVTNALVQHASSTHVDILDTLYGGGEGSVSVTFHGNTNKYDFPKAILMRNFVYFRLALRSEDGKAVYVEDERQHIHFEDIDIKVFATVHKWVTDRATKNNAALPMFWMLATKRQRNVDHLLQVAITAHYLALDHFKEFEEYLTHGLAMAILADRRAITQEVLDIISGHMAFDSGLFWRIVVKAGVRPALQEHMLYLWPKTAESTPGFGHRKGYQEWDAVLKHYQELRGDERNARYAAGVLDEITTALKNAALRRQTQKGELSGALLIRDPLRDIYDNETYTTRDVEHDFTL